MHWRFQACRIGRTEWFEAAGELENFIAQTLAEQENAA